MDMEHGALEISDSRLRVCRAANEMQATHFAVAKKGQDGDEVARYADHDESDASGYGKVEQLLRILAEQFSWGSSPIRCPIGRLKRRVAPGATAPVGAVFARGPLSRRFIHDIDQTRQISRAIRCGCVLFLFFFSAEGGCAAGFCVLVLLMIIQCTCQRQ